jgi:hypothetical protein
MSDTFEFFDQSSEPIRFHEETEAFLDMFQLQTGLGRMEAVEKVMGLGTFVYQELLQAAARADGNPRVDFVVRDRNLSTEPVSYEIGKTLDSLLHPEKYDKNR